MFKTFVMHNCMHYDRIMMLTSKSKSIPLKLSQDVCGSRMLSIMPKILEISVGIQMERSVLVSFDLNIRYHLWRWSPYFGWNVPTEIRRSIFDKLVLCPNIIREFGIRKRNKRWQCQFLLVGPV